MRRVIVETPYAGDAGTEQHATSDSCRCRVCANVRYARECMLHSLRLGEAPMLSHLLYTQVLDDGKPADRKLGIEAGLAWGAVSEATTVYIDRGVSSGMAQGIAQAEREGRLVEYRSLTSRLERGEVAAPVPDPHRPGGSLA